MKRKIYANLFIASAATPDTVLVASLGDLAEHEDVVDFSFGARYRDKSIWLQDDTVLNC